MYKRWLYLLSIFALVSIIPFGCKGKEKEPLLNKGAQGEVAKRTQKNLESKQSPQTNQNPESKSNPESKARISFKNLEYDFGEIEDGEKVTHVFKLKNIGKEKLIINSVQSSCGCTAALLSSKEIEPGDSGEIKATFDSTRFKGKVTKSITVNSNDPENSSITLKITGMVNPEVYTSPSYINFGDILKGEVSTQKLNVGFIANKKIKITKVESTLEGVTYKILPETGSNEIPIEVSFKETKKIGRVSGTLNISTDSKKKPLLSIPLYATVKGNISVTPHTLSFGIINKSHSNAVSIVIAKADKNVKEGNLEIVEIKDNDGYLDFEVVPLKKGIEYRVSTTPKRDIKPGSFRGRLTIKTNDPDQGVIEVPYFGTVRN